MAKVKNSDNTDEDVEKLDHSYIFSGNVQWHSHSGRLAVSLKTWHATTLQPRNNLRNDYLYSYENLYINVYSNFFHNNQKLKMTQCPPVGKRLSELWYIHNHGVLLDDKKGIKPSIHATTWVILQRIMLMNKLYPKRLYTLWFHWYNIFEIRKLQQWKTD